ncbi:MAG: hypothetical protein MI799_19690, partial [Desulfobacterales bacterium]|nr:hypothetical protein [Desulfobacterales bacterium]
YQIHNKLKGKIGQAKTANMDNLNQTGFSDLAGFRYRGSFRITAMGRPDISAARLSPQQSLKGLSDLHRLSYKNLVCDRKPENFVAYKAGVYSNRSNQQNLRFPVGR